MMRLYKWKSQIVHVCMKCQHTIPQAKPMCEKCERKYKRRRGS